MATPADDKKAADPEVLRGIEKDFVTRCGATTDGIPHEIFSRLLGDGISQAEIAAEIQRSLITGTEAAERIDRIIGIRHGEEPSLERALSDEQYRTLSDAFNAVASHARVLHALLSKAAENKHREAALDFKAQNGDAALRLKDLSHEAERIVEIANSLIGLL